MPSELALTSATTDPPAQTAHRSRSVRWRARGEWRWYAAAVGLTCVALTWMMRLWRADLAVPFYYSSDVLGSAAHFQTIRETGWYENQPRLGAPYGQHYHDYPFSDDLHMVMAKVITWFTPNWMVAFNTYYLLTFVLCAAAAVWFFRVCGIRPALAVVLAVLFAVAPYHFLRNEMHLFLSGYYVLPLAMVVVLRVARGERIWGARDGRTGWWATLTGRGAGTVVILVLIVFDGVYYALFTGILLVAAALLALARTRDGRRFGGAAAAAGVLGTVYLLALLPDLVYSLVNGSNGAAFVRYSNDAQFYALRLAHLVLPAPGHPVPLLAELRDWYQATFPPDAEKPALGLIATVGFVGLMVLGVAGMARARRRRPGRAPLTVDQLSALTWIAFLTATAGGLGIFISMVVVAIRGWNRMSIVIALLALAGFGLMFQTLQARLIRRWRHHPAARRMARSWLAAALVLVVGVADQSIDMAVPDYAGVGKTFAADREFFGGLEADLPDGAMVFQLPFRAFPEGPIINGTTESDQLRAFLNSTTLRWSGGGIKGRPQTDWPADVVNQPMATMVKDLAIIGFDGIVIDRWASSASQESRLVGVLGRPQRVSSDGRWAFLSLAGQRAEVALTMTAEQIRAEAAALTNGATTG